MQRGNQRQYDCDYMALSYVSMHLACKPDAVQAAAAGPLAASANLLFELSTSVEVTVCSYHCLHCTFFMTTYEFTSTLQQGLVWSFTAMSCCDCPVSISSSGTKRVNLYIYCLPPSVMPFEV